MREEGEGVPNGLVWGDRSLRILIAIDLDLDGEPPRARVRGWRGKQKAERTIWKLDGSERLIYEDAAEVARELIKPALEDRAGRRQKGHRSDSGHW